MKALVILRPEPAASTSAEQARALGLDVKTVPLFEIVPIEWTVPDPDAFDALVLTSANAVRHGGPQLERLKRLPVFAVGAATGAAAEDAGFAVAAVGERGAGHMRFPAGIRLLRLAGRDHVPIAAATTICVYQARPVETPDGLDSLPGSVAAIHSPRAGRRLQELVEDRSGIAVAAISPAAAQACGEGWQSVHAAAAPDDAALLALAVRLCDSPAP